MSNYIQRRMLQSLECHEITKNEASILIDMYNNMNDIDKLRFARLAKYSRREIVVQRLRNVYEINKNIQKKSSCCIVL